jgi:hypothetical protein
MISSEIKIVEKLEVRFNILKKVYIIYKERIKKIKKKYHEEDNIQILLP